MHSFETIVSVFAQQQEDGDHFSVMTDTILFVAELVSWVAIMTYTLCDVKRKLYREEGSLCTCKK